MVDFFISLSGKDKAWGDWIAWQLKAGGYSLIYQHWHFQTGQNFLLHMEEAGRKAKRVLAVLSDNYFRSEYTLAELTQALRRDPAGRKGTIVPVLVSECDLDGSLLGPRSYIDLVQITDESEARRRLLEGLELKKPPDTEPPFPGLDEHPAKSGPVYPGSLNSAPEDTPSPPGPTGNGRSDVNRDIVDMPKDEHATLVDTTTNPYDPWTPAVPPRFFGRERLLGELERGLEEGRSLSLVGDWRIGKSSLLFTWQQRAEAKGRVVRLVSGEGSEGISVAVFVKTVSGFQAPDDADGAANVLSHWAEMTGAPGLTPLILVDEVDSLLPRFEHRFFERLRGMLGRICLVLCSRRELDLIYEELGRGSPFHNRLQLLWLGLVEGEAAERIIDLGDGFLDKEDAELMRRWSGRHPYYLQLLGRYLVEAHQQQRSTDAALDDFLTEATARLRELWRELDERDRNILRASLAGTPIRRRSLRSRGLSTEEGRPFGEVLVEWLREEA